MDIQGNYTFDAAGDRVWALLMDPAVIAACMPGCRALRPIGDDRFRAELVVVVSAVTGNYDATIAILDKHEPQSYALAVDAIGRRGFVRGRATIDLVPAEGRTVVRVNASGEIGGTVARVGQRMLQAAGRMMMDRFFKCLAKRLAPDASSESPGTAAPQVDEDDAAR